jgi:hypothetical protein
MKEMFDVLVKPSADRLSQLLGQSFEDDHTVIPVKVTFKGGTTQTIEDGIVTECDHRGADMGDVDLADLFYDPQTGDVETYDKKYRGLVCDKCPAWQDRTGEWHE